MAAPPEIGHAGRCRRSPRYGPNDLGRYTDRRSRPRNHPFGPPTRRRSAHSGESFQRVAGQAPDRPFVHWLRADAAIEAMGRLVPVEDPPVDALVAAVDGDP